MIWKEIELGKLLAIDPGRIHTGYAVFEEGILLEAGTFRRVSGKRKKVVSADEEIQKEVECFLERVFPQIEVVVIEAARHVNESGLVDADPAELAGAVRKSYGFTFPMNFILERAVRENTPVLLVNPKVIYASFGDIGPKRIREGLRSRFPDLENADRDTLSAVAVGLYFFQRDRA